MSTQKQAVLTKEDMYARWLAMEFGNRPVTWRLADPELLTYSGHRYDIRYAETDSRRKAHGVYCPRLAVTWLAANYPGSDPSKWIISEAVPLKACAEVTLLDGPAEHGLCLALASPVVSGWRHKAAVYRGIYALAQLKRLLDPADLEDLHHLLDTYRGHVVEIGLATQRAGVCHRKMLVYEVRKY